MRLLKPIYGQASAPRQWFVAAGRRLISIGYKPHALDQCLFDDLLGGGDENHERYQEAKQTTES